MTSIYETEQAEEMNRKIAIARGWTDVQATPEYYGFTPDGYYLRLPDWWQDLNDAMLLFLELPPFSYIDFSHEHKHWHVHRACNDERDSMSHYGDKTPQALATAICQAWLQWKGVEEDE